MQNSDQRCCCCRSIPIISGILFAVIAIVHLLRAVLGWSIVIDGAEFPMWISWLIVVIGAGASAWNFCCCCCKKCCRLHSGNLPPPKID